MHGRVLTLGDNSRGQLGMGGTSGSYSSEAGGVNMHVLRGVFVGKKCQRLSCGDYFTVAATSGDLFIWLIYATLFPVNLKISVREGR